MANNLKNAEVFRQVTFKIKEAKEAAIRDRLTDIAQFVTSVSPVDTGAYVTSHSILANNSNSRARGKTSKGKPRKQNREALQQSGFSNLLSDIDAIDMDIVTRVTLRNDSPHARFVEDGNGSSRGYLVYTKTRRQFG